MNRKPRPIVSVSSVVALLLFMAAAFGPGSARPAAAAGALAWSVPVKLSADTGGWFPAVAADDFGNVHVVWNGDFPDRPLLEGDPPKSSLTVGVPSWRGGPSATTAQQVAALFYVHGNGQGWSRPNDIGLAWYGHAIRSAITVDRSGLVHLIHLGLGDLVPASLGSYDLWYTTFDSAQGASLRNMSAPAKITRGQRGYFSDMAVDSHGTLHIIWMESDDLGWGIYYAHSTDGGATWSDRVALEPNGLVWWYRAQLRIDARDNLHVVWERMDPSLGRDSLGYGTTSGAVYASSQDGGASWSRVTFPVYALPAQVAKKNAPLPGPQQPAIGIDGQGKILLVYREPVSDRIVYRLSTDGKTWSAAAAIPGVERGLPRAFDTYDMVTDSAGHVHLAMVGYPAGSNTMSLLQAEWTGQGWLDASTVATSARYPEYPRLALSEGNRLHLVWFEGDSAGPDRNPTGVWYSTARTAAPRVVKETAARRTPTAPEAVPAAAGSPLRGEGAGNQTISPAFGLPSGTEESGLRLPFEVQRRSDFALILSAIVVLILLAAILFVKLGPAGRPVGPLQRRGIRDDV